MVPEEFQDVTVRMRLDCWNTIIDSLDGVPSAEILATKPSNGRIREVLKAGPVPGCTLLERGVSLRVL
jgi:hypothetical protein